MRNPVDHDIHEVLVNRWSPYAFDPQRSVDSDTLTSLFEAARWSMSSYNAQPWRYVVANRQQDEALWNQVLETLVDGNQPWAQHAPVLALGLITPRFEKNGEINKAAMHDLGAASACLTVEATARGLVVHQMIGIKVDTVQQTFNLPDSIEPVTALAIGYAGDGSQLEEDYATRDARQRERKPLSEIILQGGF